MFEEYFENHNVSEAIFHGLLAHRYDPEAHHPNNLGYLYLASDQLPRAREFLEKAVADSKGPTGTSLPMYNLGVLEAKEGNTKRALTLFKSVVIQLESTEKEQKEAACLILPYQSQESGKLEFREKLEPDILEAAKIAVAQLEATCHERT